MLTVQTNRVGAYPLADIASISQAPTPLHLDNSWQLDLPANPLRSYVRIQNQNNLIYEIAFGTPGANGMVVTWLYPGESYELIMGRNLWKGDIYCRVQNNYEVIWGQSPLILEGIS